MSNEIKYLPASYYRVGQKVLANNKHIKTIYNIYETGINIEMVGDIGYSGCTHKIEPEYLFIEIKPILRRIDSITPLEKTSLYMLTDHVTHTSIEIQCYKTAWLKHNNFDIPEIVNGVMLSSLIDAGLAVDAATINN